MSDKKYEDYILSDEEELDQPYENDTLDNEKESEEYLEEWQQPLVSAASQEKQEQLAEEMVSGIGEAHEVLEEDQEVLGEDQGVLEEDHEVLEEDQGVLEEEHEVLEEDREAPELGAPLKNTFEKEPIPRRQDSQGLSQRQVEPNSIKNTSFQAYVQKSVKENRKGFKGIIFGTLKLIVFLMCLPFIAILLGGVVAIALGAIGGSLALIGSGIFIMAAIAFFSSMLGQTIILLAITSSITLVAAGVLGILISYMVIKWINKTIKSYYHRYQNKRQIKEEI